MYDLIYCNGDSFCAGMDLAEERYFPELKGYTWEEYQTNLTDNIKKITAMKDRWVWWPEVEKLQRQRSFINQLSELTGIPVQNDAMSGAGYTKITQSTFRSCYILRHQNKSKKIAALLGLTNPQRLWWPLATTLGKNDFSDTLILGTYQKSKTTLEQDVIKHFTINTTDDDWIINFGIAYMGIYLLLRKLDIDVYFIGTPLFNIEHLAEYKNAGLDEAINIFLDNYAGTLGGPNINNRKNEKIFTSGGHLRFEEHYNFAKELKENLCL